MPGAPIAGSSGHDGQCQPFKPGFSSDEHDPTRVEHQLPTAESPITKEVLSN